MDIMRIYNNVKNLCALNGTNVKNLEIAIGVGSATIARWNKVKPNAETLIKVADYFNVSLDYLVGRESFVSSSATEVIPHELFSQIIKLNDEGTKLLTAMARSLTIQDEYIK